MFLFVVNAVVERVSSLSEELLHFACSVLVMTPSSI